MSNPMPETTVSPETRLIPLRLLRQDDANVRGNASDPAMTQADAELVASIKAHGLLENLVVTPRTKTLFGVAAGARRLRALQVLADEKHIPKNHPVPCLVIDNDVAAESSLVENAIRVAMHPADQVRAFRRLADEGATADQIAARFGMSERTVQKRLRLGGLAEEILDAYRAGEIKLDTAQAFATTADADFQRTVFESLRERDRLYAHDIRRVLSQRHLRSDSPIATFVGMDVYREAGGAVEDPLFADDYVTILDPRLLHELATAQLQVEAARYTRHWKWSEALLESTWGDRQKFLVAAPTRLADFTDEETKALGESETRARITHEELDDCTDPDRRRELLAALDREEALSAATERDRADRHEYSEVTRAHAGVVVTIDDEGCLDVHHGLVRSIDADAYREANSPAGSQAGTSPTTNGSDASPASPTNGAAPANGSNGSTPFPGTPGATSTAEDDAPAGKKNGGYSDALRKDLRIMRTAALRRALSHDPDVATDLIGFVLARMVGFGHHKPRYEAPVLGIRKDYQPLYPSDAMKASAIMQHLEPVPPSVPTGHCPTTSAQASWHTPWRPSRCRTWRTTTTSPAPRSRP